MSLIQGFIILFALFAISRTYLQFRAGKLTLAWLFVWVIFWIGTGVVAALPQTTDIAAKFVGVGRGADFLVYIAVIGLFYLMFRLFLKIEDLEREITQLVRKLAIEEIEDKDEK
jgi:small membrane protein